MRKQYKIKRDEWDYYFDLSRGIRRYIENFQVTGKVFSLYLIREIVTRV
jgi:hypothetical protein